MTIMKKTGTRFVDSIIMTFCWIQLMEDLLNLLLSFRAYGIVDDSFWDSSLGLDKKERSCSPVGRLGGRTRSPSLVKEGKEKERSKEREEESEKEGDKDKRRRVLAKGRRGVLSALTKNGRMEERSELKRKDLQNRYKLMRLQLKDRHGNYFTIQRRIRFSSLFSISAPFPLRIVF